MLASILNFVEYPFNSLTKLSQEAVECRWVLGMVIGSHRRKNAIARDSTDIGLPVSANEPLVSQNSIALESTSTVSAAALSSV